MIVIGLSASINLLTSADWTWISGGIAALFFTLLEWGSLARVARTMVVVLVAMILILSFTLPNAASVLHQAADRGLYLGLFILSMGILQATAASSPLVHRSGRILVSQKPGRRYAALTFGGALFGLPLSVGAVGLLGTMIKHGNEGTDERIAETRLRRMTVAVLRGVGSVPLWSPTSIAIPVVLLGIPDLSFLKVLSHSAVLAVLFLGLGWLVDRIGNRGLARAGTGHAETELAPLGWFMALVASLLVVAIALAQLLDVSIISANILIAPGASLLWQYVQQRGHGIRKPMREALDIMLRRILPSLRNLRSEVTIFMISGALGILVVPLVDAEALSAAILPYASSSGAALAIAYVFVLVTGILGLNPIASVTVVIAILTQLDTFDLRDIDIAMTVLTAWAATVAISPFTSNVRIAANAIGEDPTKVGLRWNVSFVLVVSALFMVRCLLIR